MSAHWLTLSGPHTFDVNRILLWALGRAVSTTAAIDTNAVLKGPECRQAEMGTAYAFARKESFRSRPLKAERQVSGGLLPD